jgi:hypothetical protein
MISKYSSRSIRTSSELFGDFGNGISDAVQAIKDKESNTLDTNFYPNSAAVSTIFVGAWASIFLVAIRHHPIWRMVRPKCSESEDEVRRRAHSIWEALGRPEGQAEDHWFRAERELRAETEDRRDSIAPVIKL